MQQGDVSKAGDDIESEVLREELAMTQAQKRFYSSQECAEAREELQLLVDDPEHKTNSSYFKGDKRGFVERHLNYLSHKPKTDIEGYLSNLKLMTRAARHK